MSKQTNHETELLRAARAVSRLQRSIAKHRRAIKKDKADLKLERKHLRALANVDSERRPDVAPSRLFGSGVGMAPIDTPRRTRPSAGNAEQLIMTDEEFETHRTEDPTCNCNDCIAYAERQDDEAATREENRIEDGQSRWSETGTTLKR